MKKNNRDVPKWAKWESGEMPNYYVLDENVEENIRVAEWGDAWAQGMLAMRYFYGRGVEQSYEKFAEWVAKAAEQGEPLSQYILGWCYKDSIGVSKNPDESKKWFGLSAIYKDNKHLDAKKQQEIDELFEDLRKSRNK